MAAHVHGEDVKAGRVVINKTLFTLAAFSIMALAMVFTVLLLRDVQTPVMVTRAEVMTPLVRPGDKLHVVYRTIRTRSCETEVDQFFIKTPQGEVVFRGTIPGGYTLVGEQENEVQVMVPTFLQSGTYIYRASLRSDCGFYRHAFLTPDAPFTIP